MSEKQKKAKGQSQGGAQRPRRTREEWLKDRIEKVTNQDFDVISRKTMDAGDYIGLLNSHDYFMMQLRMRFGRIPGLSAATVDTLMERSNAVKAELNALNMELARILGKEYKPPRQFRQAEKPDETKKEAAPQKTRLAPVAAEDAPVAAPVAAAAI